MTARTVTSELKGRSKRAAASVAAVMQKHKLPHAPRKTQHARETADRNRRRLRRYERNILKTLELATLDDIESGVRWYADARAFVHVLAARYTVPAERVVRVLAALSPRNRWTRNLVDCEAVIAAWRRGDPESTVTVATFNANRHRAFEILNGRTLLSGDKVNAFADNILHEDSTRVTVDVHARKVAEAAHVSSDDMTGLTALQYRLIEQAYRNVAARYGIARPYMLQAIVWLTWRRTHAHNMKKNGGR